MHDSGQGWVWNPLPQPASASTAVGGGRATVPPGLSARGGELAMVTLPAALGELLRNRLSAAVAGAAWPGVSATMLHLPYGAAGGG